MIHVRPDNVDVEFGDGARGRAREAGHGVHGHVDAHRKRRVEHERPCPCAPGLAHGIGGAAARGRAVHVVLVVVDGGAVLGEVPGGGPLEDRWRIREFENKV